MWNSAIVFLYKVHQKKFTVGKGQLMQKAFNAPSIIL